MKFLIDNWYLIIAFIGIMVAFIYSVFTFVRQPRDKQLESVRKWLLWAVTEAEKELGSGTGKLKLRYVYNMFITKFSALKDFVTFEMISTMVDETLEEMRDMLDNNKAIRKYVNGSDEYNMSNPFSGEEEE